MLVTPLALLLACPAPPTPDTPPAPDDSPAVEAVPVVDCSDRAPPLPAVDAVAPVLLRRLTVRELDGVARAALDDRSGSAALIFPDDVRAPFDNDASTQQPSRDWVAAAEVFASESAARFVADPARVRAVSGCVPTAGDGAGCLEAAVRALAPVLLRRPVGDAEVSSLAAAAGLDGDLAAQVGRLVRVLLQDGEALYRVEVGTPVTPDLRLLTPWEVSSRIGFLVSDAPAPPDGPDVDPCSYYDPAFRRAVVARLLAGPEAVAAAQRLHAMWIGYERQIGSTHAPSFQQQADAMIERVLWDDGAPWEQLLRTRDTWLNEDLIEVYGFDLEGTNQGAWYTAPDPARAGLLAWGAFLATGPRATDTSPTQRGKLVQERLMCTPVPPPPAAVNADAPPAQAAGSCKVDRYAAHRADPGCAGCHTRMDGVGEGLEMYDAEGRYRTHESRFTPTGVTLDAQCPVTVHGEVPDLGPFSGPSELSALLLDSRVVQPCFVENVLRWSYGGAALPSAEVERITQAWLEAGGRYADLLAEIAASDAFVYRREG